jgi:hypothetical protein
LTKSFQAISARNMIEQSICGVNQEPITVMEDELEPIDDCGTGGGGEAIHQMTHFEMAKIGDYMGG